jgi:hypothetical protein
MFRKTRALPQEDSRINTTSGIITLKTSEWSKIIKITSIHHSCNAMIFVLSFFMLGLLLFPFYLCEFVVLNLVSVMVS